ASPSFSKAPPLPPQNQETIFGQKRRPKVSRAPSRLPSLLRRLPRLRLGRPQGSASVPKLPPCRLDKQRALREVPLQRAPAAGRSTPPRRSFRLSQTPRLRR